MSKYEDAETDYRRGMTWKEKYQERVDGISGVRQTCQTSVTLYTQKRKLDGETAEDYTEDEKNIRLQ